MDLHEVVQGFLDEQGVKPEDGIVVGCSGGVDSMVLANVLYVLGYRMGIYHMNAGLRGEEADADEDLVDKWAVGMGVSFKAGHYKLGEGKRKSIQVRARSQRYKDLNEVCKEWGMRWIATAHHKQDKLETTVLNFLRGSGIQGLTSLRERRENIIRPLLQVCKEELYAYAKEKSVPWREDASNRSTGYARNRVRLNVIPALQDVTDRGLEGAYKTIELLQEATDFLDEKLSEAVEDIVWWDGVQLRIDKAALQNNPHAGLLLHYILSPYGQFDKVGILQALNGQPGKRFTNDRFELIVDREHLIVHKPQEPEDKAFKLQRGSQVLKKPISLLTDVITIEALGEIPKVREVLCVDADKLQFPLTLRRWRSGDRFQPFGMKGIKKISDYLTDEKVPIHEKDHVYVLCSGESIVWVVGFRPDDRFKVDDNTKMVYLAELNEKLL
ncbi:MAG: tRNA lysidine(34) synthetase TilS [Bacteroidetes bacterium]|nr:MAG: tRNA lysidine(34) synthetase TilS [Bacteroidota bacterium]